MIMEQQLKFWDIVNGQISTSRIKRINWRSILGQTLTKTVAGYYAQGKTARETLDLLKSKVNSDDPILLKNLTIGVCARYGEINSESRAIKEVKDNGKQFSMG